MLYVQAIAVKHVCKYSDFTWKSLTFQRKLKHTDETFSSSSQQFHRFVFGIGVVSAVQSPPQTSRGPEAGAVSLRGDGRR